MHETGWACLVRDGLVPDDVDRLVGGRQPRLSLLRGLWPVLDGDKRCPADPAEAILLLLEFEGSEVDRQGCFAPPPGLIIGKLRVIGYFSSVRGSELADRFTKRRIVCGASGVERDECRRSIWCWYNLGRNRPADLHGRA